MSRVHILPICTSVGAMPPQQAQAGAGQAQIRRVQGSDMKCYRLVLHVAPVGTYGRLYLGDLILLAFVVCVLADAVVAQVPIDLQIREVELVGCESNIAFVPEPDNQRVPISHKDPLADIKFSAMYH